MIPANVKTKLKHFVQSHFSNEEELVDYINILLWVVFFIVFIWKGK